MDIIEGAVKEDAANVKQRVVKTAQKIGAETGAVREDVGRVHQKVEKVPRTSNRSRKGLWGRSRMPKHHSEMETEARPHPGLNAFNREFASALRVFANRNYRLIFANQFISLSGTYLQAVAQSWLVNRLTGSAAMLGFVGFVSQIPISLLAPVGGSLANRVSQQPILIATQIVSALLTLAFALLIFSSLIQTCQVFTLAQFVLALGGSACVIGRLAFAIFLPALQGATRRLSRKQEVIDGAVQETQGGA